MAQLPRRPLGSTGLEVSVLGYGGSPLGGVYGVRLPLCPHTPKNVWRRSHFRVRQEGRRRVASSLTRPACTAFHKRPFATYPPTYYAPPNTHTHTQGGL